MTDLICFKILVFRNNWIRFCAKILIVSSKAIVCMGRGGVYVCVCVCGGWGGGWVWLQEGNDIVVTENVLQIILLRRMTMIDLYKKKLLFTHNWIRSCVTIVINNLQAMFGTGWWRAIGKSYSRDGKLSLDTSAGMNDNN